MSGWLDSRHQTSYVDMQRASRAPILVSLFATVEHCFMRGSDVHREALDDDLFFFGDQDTN